MATFHGYLAVEDVALTVPQRQAVLAAFDDANLSVESAKNFLANAVGVDPSIIDNDVQMTARGPLVTYSVASIDRMRFLVFGGLSATWAQSLVQCAIYLANNISEWWTDPYV